MNTSASPSRIKNRSTGTLLSEYLHEDSFHDFGVDDETEIWNSIKVISSQANFSALLRSVRMDNPQRGILETLQTLQRNIKFPFLQRWMIPGQGSILDRAHVFKMSVKGHGSGLDILRRMKPGGSLEGTWVMFDVMHRITKDWLTFSAHVYDHNYRALCTIFTCELMAEDASSMEVAWRLMLQVAEENDLKDVTIHGFMADNAQAGWNAVRNVFSNGFADATKERSDAFHYSLLLRKHTLECVVDGKHAEHYRLWDLLRDAPSYRIAYKISGEISDWWREGNAFRGKIKILEAWKAWWVVRWRQWGSLLRVVSVFL